MKAIKRKTIMHVLLFLLLLSYPSIKLPYSCMICDGALHFCPDAFFFNKIQAPSIFNFAPLALICHEH
jgi:hypothetical protein